MFPFHPFYLSYVIYISHKLSILSWNRLGVDQENPPLCPVDFTEEEHLYWDSYSATSNNGQGNPARVSVKGEPGELDTSPPERRKRKGVRARGVLR